MGGEPNGWAAGWGDPYATTIVFTAGGALARVQQSVTWP
jgi:hypothetical protein